MTYQLPEAAICLPEAKYEVRSDKPLHPFYTAAQMQAAYAAGVAARTLSDAQEEMLQFLYGSGDLEGVWFGEVHPKKRRGYWWRENLRKAFSLKAIRARGESL